jgi:CPA1 family monovalent cation:H+ antiporter
MVDIWENHDYSHMFLILVSLLATILLIAVRFICVAFFAKDAVVAVTTTKKLKNMLLLSLSGVKGTVGLAMAFTLPYTLADNTSFKERPLILFITAAVIIIYLVLALVFVPLLSEKAEPPTGNRDEIRVLREVVKQLATQDGEHGRSAISYYNSRIRKLEQADYDSRQRKLAKQVRMYAYNIEVENVKTLLNTGKITMALYSGYNELLIVAYHQLFAGVGVQLRIFLTQAVRFVKHLLIMTKQKKKNAPYTASQGEMNNSQEARHNVSGLRDLFAANNDVVLKALHNARDKYPEDILEAQIDEREELTQQVLGGVYRTSRHTRVQKNYKKDLLRGFYVERRVIHQFLDRGEITAEQANEQRVRVNKLETYALGHDPNELVVKLIEIGSVRQR